MTCAAVAASSRCEAGGTEPGAGAEASAHAPAGDAICKSVCCLNAVFSLWKSVVISLPWFVWRRLRCWYGIVYVWSELC